eukprot:TRINITY_DN66374_c0_g1_i1.p1 TRINITY_DN66374_c0_g1~~TRINITY_DN66374_c0_g1_i1.p1  ORF type:complete len:282 (+),score=34.24 TRINITY_DN66374_c0_g1_i1:63-908(+)
MERPWVVITGASSGIGVDLCRRYAERGYNLVMVARRKELMETHASRLQAEFGDLETLVIEADLSSADGCCSCIAVLEGKGIAVAALVNNAGEPMRGRVRDVPWQEQERMLQLMVFTPARLCHWFLRQRTASPAHILNVASIGALLPTPKMALYGSVKAFLVHLSETIAAEEPDCIVVVICPGYVRTGVHEKLGMDHLVKQLPSWMWMESDAVAKEALEVIDRGQSCVYIPGLVNRVAAKFFSLPLSRKTWKWMTSTQTKRISWSEWFSSVFVVRPTTVSKL